MLVCQCQEFDDGAWPSSALTTFCQLPPRRSYAAILAATDALKSLPRPGVVPQRSPGNLNKQGAHQAVAVSRDAA